MITILLLGGAAGALILLLGLCRSASDADRQMERIMQPSPRLARACAACEAAHGLLLDGDLGGVDDGVGARACAACEAAHGLLLDGIRAGRSHGLCRRHAEDTLLAAGLPEADVMEMLDRHGPECFCADLGEPVGDRRTGRQDACPTEGGL